MNSNEYLDLAMRTNDGKANDRLASIMPPNTDRKIGQIFNACLGLSGEVGEFNDMIKKWIFHENMLYEDHAQKELGDICWYIALMCDAFGWDLDEILQRNIDKLKKRYPEGFDVNKANHRSKDDV